jgi:hypothetical protein
MPSPTAALHLQTARHMAGTASSNGCSPCSGVPAAAVMPGAEAQVVALGALPSVPK